MDQPQRQARGTQRMEQILGAAEAVIQRQHAVGFSLHEVAEEARLPPASVYHYFSGNQDLLLGLAKRYTADFRRMAQVPTSHEELEVWGDLFTIQARRSIQFYHDNPSAMRVLLGPESGWQIRSADLEANRVIGGLMYDKLVTHFVVAESDALASALPISIAIADAIWALSFARHGSIEPDLAAESLRARLAYLELYVGRHVPKRPRALERAVVSA